MFVSCILSLKTSCNSVGEEAKTINKYGHKPEVELWNLPQSVVRLWLFAIISTSERIMFYQLHRSVHYNILLGTYMEKETTSYLRIC